MGRGARVSASRTPHALPMQVAAASRGGEREALLGEVGAGGELLSLPRGGCGRVGGEVAASRAEG